MRKIYSLMLLALMAIGLSFQANAGAITIKVNKTGVASVVAFGNETTLNQAEQIFDFSSYGVILAEIHCPSNYTMTAVNETKNQACVVGNSQGDYYDIQINPGNTSDGDVFNITIEGDGTGGGEQQDQIFTVIFTPAGSGYVQVGTETYVPAEGEDEVDVPYDGASEYLIKPNAGFSLLNAKDETQTSNPHYQGITPRGDGIIYGQMGSIDAGARIVVTAAENGSFTVKGVGENLGNIQMMNLVDYSYTTVTADEQTIEFNAGVSYKIYSNTSAQLWKVEVTDAADYTTELEGSYGNFTYTPNKGDKVVIYSDKPEQHASIKLSYDGEATKNVISKVTYDDTEIEESVWESGEWTAIAGQVLQIFVNTTGYQNFTCKVNGKACTLTNGYYGTYFNVVLNNGSEDTKEYHIVISAEKEKTYTYTINCEHPEAVSIKNSSYETISFTTSGQSFTIGSANNALSVSATSGWIIDEILIDGEEPASGQYVYGTLYIMDDCTVTIKVTNKAATRTKTVVVYVDESVANPQYLSLEFNGENGVSQSIKPGYSFVKFGDGDLPFNFGYYTGSEAAPQFFVNGEKASSFYPCELTLALEDGAVIKYFNGTPTQQVVTYDISDDVADLVEVVHDHMQTIDHGATSQFALFTGTQIHIKVKEQAAAEAPRRAQAASPIVVKVNDEAIEPDEDGVYSIKVADTAPTIAVTKAITTGIEGVGVEGNETFTIYNLQGMVVKANATAEDFNSLPAGIYIANGEKVAVK